MKKIKLDDVWSIALTFSEEKSLALLIMNALSKRWVQNHFNSLLKGVYYVKSKEGVLYYSKTFDSIQDYFKIYDLEPFVPEGKDDIFTDNYYIKDPAERIKDRQDMIRLAWREAWEESPEFRRVAGEFETFPNSNIKLKDVRSVSLSELRENNRMEDAFRKEFDRIKFIMKDDDVSDLDIVNYIKDYMPLPKQ